MSAFSDAMAAVATQLITEFGQSCTFIRSVKGAYDPTTSKAINASTVNFSGVCFHEVYTIAELQASNVRAGDVKLLVSPITTGEVPTVGDELTFSSTNFRIVSVDRAVTNSVTVLYTLQCRE